MHSHTRHRIAPNRDEIKRNKPEAVEKVPTLRYSPIYIQTEKRKGSASIQQTTQAPNRGGNQVSSSGRETNTDQNIIPVVLTLVGSSGVAGSNGRGWGGGTA